VSLFPLTVKYLRISVSLRTQRPFEVWIAIDQKAAKPRIDYPPVRIVRFSGKALSGGIESYRIEGVEVKIFNIAKTIADCFKYRNKIGLDIALEALKDCRQRRLCTNDQLWKYAKVCRVSNIMKPYLEATQ
jgi:predicted transcriptional regulator of viral defense system